MYSHHKTKVNQNVKLSASRSVIYLHLSLLSNKQSMLCEEAQSEESSGGHLARTPAPTELEATALHSVRAADREDVTPINMGSLLLY